MQENSSLTAGPRRTEFIVLISSVMMLVAFGIDSMLPALPQMGLALGIENENDRPIVISAFLAGFSVSLLLAGTLSDRYGRRQLLLGALFGYALASVACSFALTFEQLLAARVVQGTMAAGGQVVIRSVVRDRFAGRDMAQVMSLASMIFMAAPILAPAMGQVILELGPWRWIFGALAIIGFLVWLWALTRLPETLAPERRIPIERNRLIEAASTVVTDRMSVGYSLAISLISCSLFGFLLSVQQIFETTFGRADLLPTGFAIMASGMAVASLTNAAIVKRYGMRLIGHAALMFFTAVAALHALVSLTGHESLVSFIVLQSVMMLGFAFVMGNFNAMAMENMGGVAGMANSLQGTLSNLTGLIVGTAIGQAFDGSTFPLYAGYTLCGLGALLIIYWTEGGRFFVVRNAERGATLNS